jgi:hypothetical protein
MPDRADAERELAELARLEELVAHALRRPDPRAALAAAASDPALSADLRARLAGASPDGARISGLLVAKLRFERLMHGSREAAEWFERDPAGFAAAFRCYHADVPPAADGPRQEARAFADWREAEAR